MNCKRVKNKINFYNEKSKCKNCLNEYKKENIECKICNTITTRNYYYKHMKKHPEQTSKPQNSVTTSAANRPVLG